jgi:hypothetical protein
VVATDSTTQEVIMTSTTAFRTPTASSSLLRVAAATFVLTTAFNALGTFADDTEGADHSAASFFVIAGISAVACAVVFGLVVPRTSERRAAAVGLGLAVAGLVLVLAFWSGLTPALAVGGVLLGAAARRHGRNPGLGSAAVAVGALALVGYVAIYVADWMATNNIAGM